MDLKLSVFKKVEHCFLLAEQHFECSLTRPRVSFSVRGQDAGRAYFPVSKALKVPLFSELRFNNALLQQNPHDFIDMVVPHECAHLISYELFGTGIKPHGREWKSLMEGLFQIKANVKHNFDISRVANKPFIYSCSCANEIALSNRQHQKVKRGDHYLCKTCRKKLRFSHEIESPERNFNDDAIQGLYIYCDESKSLEKQTLARLDYILDRKPVNKIFSSKDLTVDNNFQQWLRRNSLLRKYVGQVHRDELLKHEASTVFREKVSHAVLLLETLDAKKLDPWIPIKQQGVMIRTLKVEN